MQVLPDYSLKSMSWPSEQKKTCFCSARCCGMVTSTRTSLIPWILNVPPARHRLVLQRGRRRKDKKDQNMHRGKETKAHKTTTWTKCAYNSWEMTTPLNSNKHCSINLQASLFKGFSKKEFHIYSRKFHFLFLPTISSWQVVFLRGFLLSWIIQPHLTTFQLTLRDSVSRVVVLVDSLQLDRLFIFHWNFGSGFQSYTKV